MNHSMVTMSGPLGRLPEDRIRHLLRGFPDSSIAGAIALRRGSALADFEACLFGILMFYQPPGTEPPEGPPSGDMRLHEDIGLDSISVLGAMLKIEELFDIRINHVELAEIVTIDDGRRLLAEKLIPAPGPNE
ncbi:MAG TPA: acyl carrier protein [Roseibacillus sp.]|nr:acyl carrier protein [Roseibacillus sp.]